MIEYTKERPLRVMTLCSGYDSQCLALNRLKEVYPEFDYELVAWSEFAPESKSPLKKQPAVVAHNALFPQLSDRNWGDMTKIDWEKVPDMDLLFYSTPCQSISAAGLQHGFVEGSGTRSSIIWNVRDADIDKIHAYPYESLIEHPAYSKDERFRGMTEKEKRAAMKRSISESAQYKLAGNSIVVDVLFHIFRKMFIETENENQQLSLF